jgi:hypothetical protein
MKNTENKSLCKSHITALRKVACQLALNQTMGHTQLILSKKNKAKMVRADQLLLKVKEILVTIN